MIVVALESSSTDQTLCEPAFAFMILSVYIPFFYIQKYALRFNIDGNMAFYLLSIMNATSLIGRVGPSVLADR